MFTIDPLTGYGVGMSHLDTETGYPRRVPRPRYEPPDDNVASRIDKVVDLHRRKQEIEAEYRQLLTELADPEVDDVPVAYLAKRLDMERKTIYRHIGRPMQ